MQLVKKISNMIKVRVPLRMSFFGGGTDIVPFAEKYGGAVISSTINKYVYCSIASFPDQNHILIHSKMSTYEKSMLLQDGENVPMDELREFFYASFILKFFDLHGGIELWLETDMIPGTGLGFSSARIASIVYAISLYRKDNISKLDLARLTYEIEREHLHIVGGYQDPYATVFGGFHLYEFNKAHNVIVHDINMNQRDMKEFQEYLVLYYLGYNHNSSDILTDCVQNFNLCEEQSSANLLDMKQMAYEAVKFFEQGEYIQIGTYLDEAWNRKKRMSNQISNQKIDNFYMEAKKRGAIGGKILGAGAGGFFLLFCNREDKQKLVNELHISEGLCDQSWEFEQYGAYIIES